MKRRFVRKSVSWACNTVNKEKGACLYMIKTLFTTTFKFSSYMLLSHCLLPHNIRIDNMNLSESLTTRSNLSRQSSKSKSGGCCRGLSSVRTVSSTAPTLQHHHLQQLYQKLELKVPFFLMQIASIGHSSKVISLPVIVWVELGRRFGKRGAEADRTARYVQEKNGKDAGLLEILSPNRTGKWNLGPHYPLQRWSLAIFPFFFTWTHSFAQPSQSDTHRSSSQNQWMVHQPQWGN